MNQSNQSSELIRSTIRKIEHQINQARYQRTCSTEPLPVIPAWAQPELNTESEVDTPPRLKARRKAPTDFSSNPGTDQNEWKRKAG